MDHGEQEQRENKLGFRGYAIHLDNTVLYHAFHEIRVGALFVRGEGNVLFMHDDIEYYNRTEGLDADQLAGFAAKLAELQAALRAQHRAIVPIIVPSKTSVYACIPQQVPGWRWHPDFDLMNLLASPAPSP
jgi:hypothetical protein